MHNSIEYLVKSLTKTVKPKRDRDISRYITSSQIATNLTIILLRSDCVWTTSASLTPMSCITPVLRRLLLLWLQCGHEKLLIITSRKWGISVSSSLVVPCGYFNTIINIQMYKIVYLKQNYLYKTKNLHF